MRGYTQEKFAEIIDITPRNLNRIESGENFVSSDTLDKILSALNVTAETLFSFEHLKSEPKMITEMYAFIDKIKFKPTQLEKAYRIFRIMADDEF
jgi:transcriptional regulator with XRE-family HTH domain